MQLIKIFFPCHVSTWFSLSLSASTPTEERIFSMLAAEISFSPMEQSRAAAT